MSSAFNFNLIQRKSYTCLTVDNLLKDAVYARYRLGIELTKFDT